MRFGSPSVSNFPESRRMMLVLLSVAVCMGAADGAVAETPTAFQGSWSPVVKIDCVDSPPDSQVGGSEVVRSKLGAYRQGGSRIGDRFVYRFRLSAPNRLVRATVRYPDDRMRAAGVSAWGPPQEALGSGFMCGDDIPLSHRMVARRFVFYSRYADAAIVFSTEAPNQPVATAS
jgi:hypothetical protein